MLIRNNNPSGFIKYCLLDKQASELSLLTDNIGDFTRLLRFLKDIGIPLSKCPRSENLKHIREDKLVRKHFEEPNFTYNIDFHDSDISIILEKLSNPAAQFEERVVQQALKPIFDQANDQPSLTKAIELAALRGYTLFEIVDLADDLTRTIGMIYRAAKEAEGLTVSAEKIRKTISQVRFYRDVGQHNISSVSSPISIQMEKKEDQEGENSDKGKPPSSVTAEDRLFSVSLPKGKGMVFEMAPLGLKTTNLPQKNAPQKGF